MNNTLRKLGRLGQLICLCDKESDKGLVLSLTSLIETTIQEIVFAFVVNNDASKELAQSSKAPIGQRVKLACSLGLISNLEMKTIQKLCAVRNEFAHGWDATFETPRIVNKMADLANEWLKFDIDSNQKFREQPYRKLFLDIAFMLLTDLVHRAEEVSKFQLKPIEWDRITWSRKMDD